MSQKTSSIFIVALVFICILVFASVFTVHQTQKALVLQFGELKHIYNSPGLKFKIPFIQSVIYYDRRLQGFILPPIEVTAGDQKKLIVDLYTRYVIKDPLQFYKTVGFQEGIKNRLQAIVPASMRTIIGRYPLAKLLSEERSLIMQQIHEQVRLGAQKFGVDVLDVRVVAAELPKQNSESIYNRMRSDRVRIAKKFRAEGQEAAQKIRANADRERQIIMAEAQKKAEVLKGEGSAKAIKIYAKAFTKDPKFFEFYRTMRAYDNSLVSDQTTFIISPDNEFFRYFGNSSG